MALAYPIDRRYVVTAADHEKYPTLGEPSPTAVGMWSVSFAPSDDWVGSFQITARERGRGPGDDSAGFGGIGYIRVQLNMAAADYGLTNDLIQGHATILIPASGLSVALATTVTQGTCTIYSTPLEGDVAPTYIVTA